MIRKLIHVEVGFDNCAARKVAEPSPAGGTPMMQRSHASWPTGGPMRRLFICAVLALAATTARAEFVSSKTLSGWLDSAASTTGSFKDTTIALGYVAGVNDLLDGTEVCAPENIRDKKMLMELRGWMRRNLGKWDDNAAITVRSALTELYPCTAGQR
jgi:hypothetical protein